MALGIAFLLKSVALITHSGTVCMQDGLLPLRSPLLRSVRATGLEAVERVGRLNGVLYDKIGTSILWRLVCAERAMGEVDMWCGTV